MQAKLLTQEQLAALISFAQDNGRNWKTELRDSWMTCNYAGRNDGHLLNQIRNQFGPTWLVNFNLKAAAAQQVEASDKSIGNKQTKYFVTEVVDYDYTGDTRTATVDSLKAARLLAKKWLGKACRRAKWPTHDEPEHQLEDLESYEDPTTNCVHGVTIFRINKEIIYGSRS